MSQARGLNTQCEAVLSATCHDTPVNISVEIAQQERRSQRVSRSQGQEQDQPAGSCKSHDAHNHPRLDDGRKHGEPYPSMPLARLLRRELTSRFELPVRHVSGSAFGRLDLSYIGELATSIRWDTMQTARKHAAGQPRTGQPAGRVTDLKPARLSNRHHAPAQKIRLHRAVDRIGFRTVEAREYSSLLRDAKDNVPVCFRLANTK